MTSTIIRRLTLAAVITVGAVWAPSHLHAQSTGADAVAPSGPVTRPTPPLASAVDAATPAPVGPRVAPAGFDRRLAADDERPSSPQQDRNLGAGANVALMGVGAAAVVIGLLIGGDGGTLVAITGGAIGLYGLFRFLR